MQERSMNWTAARIRVKNTLARIPDGRKKKRKGMP
jgi:hypothetical protein